MRIACELFSPHISVFFISPHVFSHVIKVSWTVFISSEHWSALLISSKLFSAHLRFCTPENRCCQRGVSCTKKTLGAEHFSTQTLEIQMHLHTKPFPKYFVLQSLRKGLPSTTWCSTKFAQTTSQYYCVLQNLHKARSNYFFVLQSLH